MVGMSGDGSGKKYKEEANTYESLSEGPLHSEYGLIRFTSEDEILELYSGFSSLEYDYLIRSIGDRQDVSKEWIIRCIK